MSALTDIPRSLAAVAYGLARMPVEFVLDRISGNGNGGRPEARESSPPPSEAATRARAELKDAAARVQQEERRRATRSAE